MEYVQIFSLFAFCFARNLFCIEEAEITEFKKDNFIQRQ